MVNMGMLPRVCHVRWLVCTLYELVVADPTAADGHVAALR